MGNVIKDIGEIWTRLFDHRPFINGEIKFFLQEFEETRDKKDVEKLFKILQNLTEIKYTYIDQIFLQAQLNLLNLKKKLDESCTVCSSILEREPSYKLDPSILEKRKLRKTEWDLFINDIAQKCVKIDEAFNDKEKNLYDHYTKLEEKALGL